LQPILRELDRIRGRARRLLLLLRTAHWLTAVIVVALLASVADYLLRLPGYLRLALVLLGLVAGLVTLVISLRRAISVRPALSALALRLERIYPHTAGHLASAVAFAGESHHEDAPISAVLASRTTAAAQNMLNHREIARLLDHRKPLIAAILLALALAAVGSIATAAPTSFMIALARWTNPLGDARWPSRFAIESMTTAAIAPNNAPLPVAARVSKGDSPTLRASVIFQFEKDGQPLGPPQRALLTRQNNTSDRGSIYQRLIEPQPAADRLILSFQAGDDTTDTQTIRLIEPPTLHAAVAQITPPAYAADFLPPQRLDLITPPRPAVTLDALAGSRLSLLLTIKGSFNHLPPDSSNADSSVSDSSAAPTPAAVRQWVGDNLPGLLSGLDDARIAAMDLALSTTAAQTPADPVTVQISWTLRQPGQFRFHFADAFGSRYDDPRLFRFETREDRPPRATILQPAGDESVLPTAIVNLGAEAQDDVAIADLALQARPPKAAPLALASVSAAHPRAALEHSLDLAPLSLSPGQELLIVAIARDNYLIDNLPHPPVESTPRRLTIISEQELVRQIRTDLAEIRQRAVRSRDAQQSLLDLAPDRLAAQQQHDLAQRIEAMQRTNDQLQDRTQRNRLNDAALSQLMTDVKSLLKQGRASASQAADALDQAAAHAQVDPPTAQSQQDADKAAAARQSQQAARQKLDDLVQLLDQGKDAYELKQQLAAVAKEQEAISEQTRQVLPRTLGQAIDQLPPEDRQALERIADEQAKLSQQTRQLVDRMRSTAAALDRQSSRTDDQATAEALRQAAATATQQALEQKMSEASQEASGNRLSQSTAAQQQAMDTLRQMLEQVGRTQQIRHEILQRKLVELADAIRKLRDTQQAQLDRLIAAAVLTDLDAPLMTLRRNTLTTAQTARDTDEQAEPIALLLDKAAVSQATAIAALRAAPVEKPTVQAAELDALSRLNEALAAAEKLANDSQDKEQDQRKEKLIAAYKQALAQQLALLDATTQLVDAPAPQRDRRWRGQSMQAAQQQITLRGDLSTIQKDLLEPTVVYQSVHDQMDAWAHEASQMLEKAQPDAATVFNQRMIAASIQGLIDALAPDKPDEKFATPQGGGGGGSGAGQKPPLIPPAAEVKLLRARQIAIEQATRSVHDAGAKLPADMRSRLVSSLAQQQVNLADTAAKLLQQLQQQQDSAPAPAPGPGPAPKPEGDAQP
jgi:hypothetical protein